MKKINSDQTTLYRRAFGGWKSTITRLFVFTLCISAIIALAVNSRHESLDKLPTELSVASSALPIETDNVVSVEETEEVVEVSTVETSESDEIVFDETSSNEKTETFSNKTLADNQPGEQEEIATSNADVFEEAPIVATTPSENENEVADVALCASEARVELRTGSISEIRIGYRVPGSNPEGNDGSDESVFVNEKHVVYTLRVPKADGTYCTAKLLRSENWLYDVPTRYRSVIDGHVLDEVDVVLAELAPLPYYIDRNFELEVWIDLEDQGCVGWSKIVDVDRSFKYAPGEGNLVTGTFEHVAQDVIDLQIEGQEKPIGCTPTHAFWSVDREEFVPAGELFEGERVRVLNGNTKRVVQKLPRPDPELVYNLEVFGEHVYHVASDGVLVHNDCPKELEDFIVATSEKYDVVELDDIFYFYPKNSPKPPIVVGEYKKLRTIKDKSNLFGDQAHHVVRQKMLEVLGKDVDKGVSILLPADLHKATRTYGRKNWSKYKDKVPIEELNEDIKDLRELLGKKNYDSSLIEKALGKIEELNKSADIEHWDIIEGIKKDKKKL